MNKLIEDINKYTEGEIPISKEEYDLMGDKIDMIGDDFLKSCLNTTTKKIIIK